VNTFRYRWGEEGRDYTRAGLAVHAMKLAHVWAGVPDAFDDTIALYLGRRPGI